MRSTFSAILALFLASTAYAAPTMPPAGGTGISNPTTIASLPTAAGKARIALITNGSTGTTACSTTGAAQVLCCEGAGAWAPCPIYNLDLNSQTTGNYLASITVSSPLTGTSCASHNCGLTLGCQNATTAAKGCASFNTASFADDGAGGISVKSLGIVNAQLAANAVTFDKTSVANLQPSTNPALSAHQCFFTTTDGTTAGGLICEGTTADLIETVLTIDDPTSSDKIIHAPNASGTLAVSATAPIVLSALGNVTCSLSTTSSVGCAQFSPNDFVVSSGVVTLNFQSVQGTEIDFNTVGIDNINNLDLASFDPTYPANEAWFGAATAGGAGGIIFEGATANGVETTLVAADPTVSDKLITLPNETGTVCTSGGTCATSISGNAATVTVADSGAATSLFPLFGTATSGSLAPKTDAGLTYNASTDALTATTFVGALSGNASTATTATNVSGTVGVANGGTGITSAVADAAIFGSGGSTAFSVKAMPTTGTNGCAGTSDKLVYNTTTHLFSCGADQTASVSAANPTASVGLTAINGAAATYMRSDAAPPIDQAIAPTWTAMHKIGRASCRERVYVLV